MENLFESVIMMLTDKGFTDLERNKLNKLFDKIPEDDELMDLIVQLNCIYFKKGISIGINFEKGLNN